MNAVDYVYDCVLKGCLREGVKDNIAANAATSALRKYKTNQFKKVSQLILQQIKDAKAGRV